MLYWEEYHYNPMLDTFITVADYGSFTKAAAQLYISPTAVMKQMNALEQHLQLQLIERTPAGVHLTPAGNVIYRDAKFLMDYSKKSIAAANAAAHTSVSYTHLDVYKRQSKDISVASPNGSYASECRISTAFAISSNVIPPIRLTVFVKYLSITSESIPIASKILEP